MMMLSDNIKSIARKRNFTNESPNPLHIARYGFNNVVNGLNSVMDHTLTTHLAE